MGYLDNTFTKKKREKDDHKIVSYSSRSLSLTDQRYSQTKREFFCKHNRLYLRAKEFTLYKDRKAIVNLLNNVKSKVILQIGCFTLLLQGYNFNFEIF